MHIYNEVYKTCNQNAHKTAMVLWGADGPVRSYTFSQVLSEAERFAQALSELGLKPGGRVAMVAESCPEWSFGYLAALKLGGTPVLLDASLPAGDLSELLLAADACCVYASAATLDKIAYSAAGPVLDIHGAGRPFPGHERPLSASGTVDGSSDIASIIFSSGTTRRAMGVMHGHEAVIGSTLMCCDSNAVTGEDRFLGVLPNSHIYGLYVQVIAPLILGGSVCYIESMDAACLAGAMTGYKPTVFPAVPRVFELLRTSVLKKVAANPKTKKLFDLLLPLCIKVRRHTGFNLGAILLKSVGEGFGGCMRVIASAGAPTDRETAEFYYGVGLNLLITYGATETSIPVIGNYGGQLTTDTCGRPYPAIKVRQSAEGEFLIKSPYLMLGYFRDAEATAACYDEEGWFKTGDWGFVDAKENIHFCGRLKDNIVLATGKKLAPDDVEQAYAAIDFVEELVICGIPDAEGGSDRVHAFVVADPAHHEAVRAALAERGRSLSQNMRLADVHFVESIPKTTLQKPKRFLLRRMVEQQSIPATAAPAAAPVDAESHLRQLLSRLTGTDPASIQPDTRLFEELALDSLGAIELALEIESLTGSGTGVDQTPGMTFGELTAAVDVLMLQPDAGGQPMRAMLLEKKRQMDYALFNLGRTLMRWFYNIRVENAEVLPEQGGYIICSNHVTNFDYLLLTLRFQRERFMTFCCMAKQELFSGGFISRTLTRVAGMIPVDRTGTATAAMRMAKERLMDNWGLLVHPEGTRSRTGEMGAFKPGAALLAVESGVPIIPACIRGGYEVYPATQALPKLFNLKTFSKYRIEVIYGEPISPAGLTPELLMQRVSAAVERMAAPAHQPTA